MKEKASYDKIANAWDEIYCQEVFYKEAFSFIDKYRNDFGLPRIIHDIACGSGILLSIFREQGYTVSGSDISMEMIKLSKEKMPNSEFQVSSFKEFYLYKAVPIMVCFYNSISYAITCADMESLFSKIKKCLLPGGIFIFDLYQNEKGGLIINFDKLRHKKATVFRCFCGIKIKKIIRFIIMHIQKSEKFRITFESGKNSAFSSDEIENIINLANLTIIYKGAGYMNNGETTYVLKKGEEM
jgi:SAM-dependent methyltransferase